ncbi:PQQ-dependent sugar dehydrogenase [Microbacterium sp. STN6]|uniref:PQQ-dependent sugar dehydrogenase n=1 Tax=Microbacterium sp. STN6 TaxID=2995588 RepID=UPI002260D9D7|nr:PQQ-dependent sugar dehydrogenase [Microbacterium sp. STN6]MCX7523163.1 PQQ-dependent sugar dehydrogenase [Microbacterium sp. STN6]
MSRMRHTAAAAATAAAVALCASLAGCTPPEPAPSPTHAALSPPASAEPSASAKPLLPPVQPVGDTADVQTGLEAPWSMLRLPSGSTIVSERDSGTIIEVLPGGQGTHSVGRVPGVVHEGEGGLLGLAAPKPAPGGDPDYIYAYLTTARDNRVVRMRLHGVPGSYTLGRPEVIVDGIPKAAFHDGGRIAFGPDGLLYVTTGDATGHDNAQNLGSLGGKILRVTATGDIPADNPFPGSPVYSYGHRNPQGIAWDSQGRLWASEFGQNTWDELNLIRPGGDYGWPVVEGIAHDKRFIDPVHEWATSDASPSGIAITHDTIFMAGLGGARLWVIYPDAAGASSAAVDAVPYLVGAPGRLRDVLVDSSTRDGGTLWLLTNNTDGRGQPRAGDDRIVSLRVHTLVEG